jgi:dTDP-4-dehydrorhamnose 3,5-epimerase
VPLNRISTKGGDVLHALKSNDIDFSQFGEIYFSWVEKNSIKAWKKHTMMSMNLVVPVGLVRFVFFDEVNKQFTIHEIGESNYMRLHVPPNTWFGFQGIYNEASLVTNISDILHDPDEVERLLPEEIEYNWELI